MVINAGTASFTSTLSLVQSACNICGSIESTHVTSGTDYGYGVTSEVFNVVRCLQCGFSYLNPRPDESELSRIYPAHYANYNVEDNYDKGDRNSPYYRLRYSLIRTYIERGLRRFFRDKKQMVMLDVGCADGHVLNCLKQARTHQIETYGVDISPEAVAKAKASGHSVLTGRFEDTDFPDNFFDLVHASHVIEHVADPTAFTKKAFQILKPGGIFFIWTPNIASIDAKWFEDKFWGPYCFPRHWHLFDPDSVRRLAKNTNFAVEEIIFVPTAATWLYTLHSIFAGHKRLARYADLLFPLHESMRTTFANFVRNSIFTSMDCAILLLTGQTSNMGVAFRKPL